MRVLTIAFGTGGRSETPNLLRAKARGCALVRTRAMTTRVVDRADHGRGGRVDFDHLDSGSKKAAVRIAIALA
ncbi:hypothetical protein [Candidatus Methylacidithermus pantelleriae]|uniref:hypothetical protein n=1 Tax=Candidatus Methylacidithermus pantelleriae TaxID=2744239 RepID=UPI00157E1DCB|nr:hypothetical protein [Candidatus Methylacidithermus pantelleriae]